MKDIRKIFNIKKKQTKEKSTFLLWEVIVISFAIAVLTSIVTGYAVYIFNDKNKSSKELSDIIDTFKKIEEEYYEDVDSRELADSAVEGMMKYLDEKYSEYLDSEDTTDLDDKLNGSYEGIGIRIGKINGEIIIINVFDDSPANKAGLKVGDKIIKINNQAITEQTPVDDIATNIGNLKEITMKVTRDKKELDFTIKVETLDVPVVKKEIFEENDKKIGYLYLSNFNSTALNQVKKALNSLETEAIDSLIFDVRSNTGGYLNSARDIASLFLKKGKTIYSLESKNDSKVIVDDTKEERTYPIVVLINEKTASASEILAASLKESYGAILVGTTSYGKGKVQQTSKLSDETMIKYTTAKWFTPNGNSIDGIGLAPGINVELTEEYVNSPTYENDAQLNAALKLLSE